MLNDQQLLSAAACQRSNNLHRKISLMQRVFQNPTSLMTIIYETSAERAECRVFIQIIRYLL